MLGGALKGECWESWRTLLSPAWASPLNEDEREIFRSVTGRDREPLHVSTSSLRWSGEEAVSPGLMSMLAY